LAGKSVCQLRFCFLKSSGFQPFLVWIFLRGGFLVEEGRIDLEIVAMIKSWRHTGLTATIQVAALRVPIPSGCSPRILALRVSVDNSVRIEAGDEAGMQRLVEYISRCPFSLARMVSLTDNGNPDFTSGYRASKPGCIPFPKQGDPELEIGIPWHRAKTTTI
jgi:hypothetical protein